MKQINRSLKFLFAALFFGVGHFAPAQAEGRLGGSGPGGGDTHISQLKESFLVASQLLEKTKTLNNVSEELKKSYKQHRDNWLNILKADPSVVPSKGRLYIGKSERAAMADDATGTIELNKLFWQENSMTMVDSVVLALQESGHLIKMPLNHEELEQIGKALIRQNQKITDKPEKTGGSYARLCVEGAKSKFNSSGETFYDYSGSDADDPPFKYATNIVYRYLRTSGVPNVAKLADKLEYQLYKTYEKRAWVSKSVINLSTDIAKNFALAYLKNFESLEEELSKISQPRDHEKVLAEAEQLRSELRPQIKPLNLKEVYSSLISLKKALEDHLPPHNGGEFKSFLNSLLEQIEDLRLSGLRTVETTLTEVQPIFESTNTKDLEEKLLPALKAVTPKLLDYEKHPYMDIHLPVEDFRFYVSKLKVRTLIGKTARNAMKIKTAIDAGNPDLNKIIDDLRNLENEFNADDMQLFFSNEVASAIKKSFLTSRQLRIPSMLKNLDEMVEEFRSENKFGQGFIIVESIAHRLGELEVVLTPTTEQLISTIIAQHPAERVRAAKKRTSYRIDQLRKYLDSKYLLTDVESLYRSLALDGITLYQETAIPKNGYKILKTIVESNKDFDWFRKFLIILGEVSDKIAKSENRHTHNPALIWCQDY